MDERRNGRLHAETDGLIFAQMKNSKVDQEMDAEVE